MCGGSSVSISQRCKALPTEISWRGQWPVLTSHHPAEGMKSSSAVPAVSLTSGNAFATVTRADACWAGVSPWGCCPRTELVPLYAGTLVLLCLCQCGSWQFQAHSGAPMGFLFYFVFLSVSGLSWIPASEKQENWCCAPLGSGGAFCGEWVAVVWCSIPLHKLPRCSQNIMLCMLLCAASQSTSKERVLQGAGKLGTLPSWCSISNQNSAFSVGSSYPSQPRWTLNRITEL